MRTNVLFLFVTVLDSWGKPEPGILSFNLQWLGNFEECVTAKSANISQQIIHPAEFKGQYCTIGALAKPYPNPLAPRGKQTFM